MKPIVHMLTSLMMKAIPIATHKEEKEFPSTTYDALMDVDDSDEDEARKWAKFAAHVDERCRNAKLAPGSTGCSHMRRWILGDYRRLFLEIVRLGDKVTLSALAAHMDRSLGSVQSRLFMLGLVEVAPPQKWATDGVWHGAVKHRHHTGYVPYSAGFLMWSHYGRTHKLHHKICGAFVELEHLATETGLFVKDGKAYTLTTGTQGQYLQQGEVKKGP